MKKCLILIINIIFIITLYGEEYTFYIPEKEELIDSAGLYTILMSMEDKKDIDNKEKNLLIDFYNQYLNENSFSAYTFKSFLRFTKNKKAI